MKRITYGAGSFTTSADIADALMDYSIALARRREMQLVDLPFLTADGDAGRARFPVGWMSDVASVADIDEPEVALDAAMVTWLHAQILSFAATRAPLLREDFDFDSWSDFDLDALDGER